MNKEYLDKRQIRRTNLALAVNILIAIAYMSFISDYDGFMKNFVNGYLLDILVPFGFFFLISVKELVRAHIRGFIVFFVCAFFETAQYMGNRFSARPMTLWISLPMPSG
jgi:hypothetical protein